MNKNVIKGSAIECRTNYNFIEKAGVSIINNSLFQANEAILYGGAIYLQNQEVRVENCSFIDNSANEGGGVYINIYGKN